jgi:hypothetical protein
MKSGGWQRRALHSLLPIVDLASVIFRRVRNFAIKPIACGLTRSALRQVSYHAPPEKEIAEDWPFARTIICALP